MSTCKGCEAAATEPDTAVYGPGCEQCCARSIACITVIRSDLAAGDTPRFRRTVAQFFPGREQHGQELVKAWWRQLRDHARKPSKEIAR